MNGPDEIRRTVSEAYASAVEQTKTGEGCCSGSASEGILTTLVGYGREVLVSLPVDAVRSSFGCGNPVALAEIREGDTVLDLGSGAGIDLLLAAKLASPTGKVISVDMTPAMVEPARANAAAARLTNIIRDRLTYDKAQLGALLGADDGGSCCCGSGGLPKAVILRMASELGGKVASIRGEARKTEEVIP